MTRFMLLLTSENYWAIAYSFLLHRWEKRK